MPLFLIGLGLGDEKDVTIKGAEAIARCDRVFLEAYTSILGVSKERLEVAFGKTIEIAYRETVESETDTILVPARTQNVALLVVGDPLGATTHTDIIIRAYREGIAVTVIHNASIMNAVSSCGLQLYNFGQTVSIPFFTESWRPESFYDKIAFNASGGLHTLCLLDIKVREPDFAALANTGKVCFEAPRFMTVNTAVEQLMEIELAREGGLCGGNALAIGMARVGQADQRIVAGTLAQLAQVDFGAPLHSLVLVGGTMHEIEQAMFDHYAVKP